MTAADFDPLKTARINTLHAAIEAIAWDHSDLAFKLRDSFYQAVADINTGWVTVKTEYAVARASCVVSHARGRAA